MPATYGLTAASRLKERSKFGQNAALNLVMVGGYRFGPFRFDVRERLLYRGSDPVLLTPKAADTLFHLVSRHGALVEKSELMQLVWPASFVEEATLAQNVFTLRRKLGQTAEGEEYIQTVPRRGYRMGVPVQELPDESSASEALPEAAVRQNRRVVRPAWMLAVGAFSIAVLVTAWMIRVQPITSTASTFFQITHDGKDKRGATGSIGGPDAPIVTDGARLYFTEGSPNASSLMEVSANGGETAPISISADLPQLLDFSAARSELLVVVFIDLAAPAQLWAVPTPAGSPHRLANLVGRDASWSPDGRDIAFVDGEALYRAKQDGTEKRKLASLPGSGWRPRWSPDGKLLRVTVADTKNYSQSLWEITSEGGNLHPLLPGWNNPPAECCGNWTPDGKQFVYQATREGKTEIWSLPSPSIFSFFVRSLRAPVQITSGQMNSLAPMPSPDGRKLYMIGQHLRGELSRYDAKTSQFLPYLGGISADFADFSGDGQWMTYVAYPEGTLWRSRIDGTDRLQLTFAPMTVMVPRWSPDGSRIVFFGTGTGKGDRIYVLSANGGTPEPVSQEGNELHPSWSPDGAALMYSDAPFFAKNPEQVAVHTINLKTGKRETIPGSKGLFAPRWSPDGRYIAATPLDGQRILLFDFQTQKWEEIAKGWAFENWSRDSQYLYYMRGGKAPAILRIRLRDRKVEEVASLSGVRQGGRLAGLQFSLAPDESPVLLRDTGTQEIYSLNWQSR